MPRKSKEDYVVLSELERTLLTLLYARSLYGTEFVDAIQELSNDNRKLKFGSLYPTLTRMEKKGYVTWHWGDETSGPRRKYYDITEEGKRWVMEARAFSQRCWQFGNCQVDEQADMDVATTTVDAAPVLSQKSS